MRGYAPEPVSSSMHYSGQYRPEQMEAGPLQYAQGISPLPGRPLQQQHLHQQHHGYAAPPAHAAQPAFSAPERPALREAPDFQSPRQQRKTKGHVASACVPCKRAHLRYVDVRSLLPRALWPEAAANRVQV